MGRLRNHLSKLFFLFVLCSVSIRAQAAEPFFDPADKKLTCEYTNVNYYLNSLVGEDEYYADDFYDDYLVSLEGKPIVHFTKRHDEVVDFYFYVEDPGNLKIIHDFFSSHKADVDKISPKLIPVFNTYYALKAPYSREGLYSKVSKVITGATGVDVEPVLTEHSRRKLDNAVYQYLRSNGIKALTDIPKNKDLLKIMIDKFFMLSTTCFYRAWDAIEKARPFIKECNRQAVEQRRPLKIKVYAASTGEEVVTYAVELFESGIDNFRILASDINDSSLKFASDMRYSKTSFDQLSSSSQQKLKKYFRLNDKAGFWEPIDRKLFSQRIKFINQDILKPLPQDLEPDFSGPYDLVSILNVLMYLDDPAVQKAKEYWLSILNQTGGVLILHDKLYSILRRKLGDRWGVDNFLLVDDWVNVRDVRFKLKDRIAIYEKEYNTQEDTDFLRLNGAYIASGMRDKALSVAEDYVAKKPFSFVGLYMLLEQYIANKNIPKASAMVNTLARVYIFPERLLDSIAALQDSTDDARFLEALKKEYAVFTADYKNDLVQGEKVFDTLVGKNQRWEPMRLTLKSSAYGFLQRHYIKENDIPNAERISELSLKLTMDMAKRYKDYYIPSRFLDEVLRYLAYYYVAKLEYDKLYDFSLACSKVFNEDYAGVDYVFIHDGLGFANLNIAIAMDARRDYGDRFFSAVDKAIEAYGKIEPQEENIGQSNLRSVFQEIGHCYMLRAKAYLAANDRSSAAKDCNEAFAYFEKGISMDPVYSREILKLRDALYVLAKKNGIDLKL